MEPGNTADRVRLGGTGEEGFGDEVWGGGGGGGGVGGVG
jgi:hypothetical protein